MIIALLKLHSLLLMLQVHNELLPHSTVSRVRWHYANVLLCTEINELPCTLRRVDEHHQSWAHLHAVKLPFPEFYLLLDIGRDEIGLATWWGVYSSGDAKAEDFTDAFWGSSWCSSILLGIRGFSSMRIVVKVWALFGRCVHMRGDILHNTLLHSEFVLSCVHVRVGL